MWKHLLILSVTFAIAFSADSKLLEKADELFDQSNYQGVIDHLKPHHVSPLMLNIMFNKKLFMMFFILEK